MHLPGFGPKRARRLYDELGVDSLDALRAAAEQGRIRELRGFGAKVEENLVKVAGRRRRRDARAAHPALPRAAAWPSRSSARCARTRPPIASRSPGSLRRLTDAVKDVDVIATASDPAALVATLGELPIVESVEAAGEVGARVLTHSGMKVDLKVVEPDQFGNVLQHFTGAKAHNVALREAAVRRGLHVSEYGILDDATGETMRCADRGGGLRARSASSGSRPSCARAAASSRPPRPAAADCPARDDRRTSAATCTRHTTLSDGRRASSRWRWPPASAATSTSRITDHSATHGFGKAVSPEALARADRGGARAQRPPRGHRDADRDRDQHPPGRLASTTTTSCSRSSTGSSRRCTPPSRCAEREMTDRMIAAIEHPLVDVIGHPTGRKIETRAPYAVDVERLIEAAARTGTMLEINAAPDRRDLNDVHARAAARGRRADRDRLRRPLGAQPRAHALRDRHRPPRVARAAAGRQHPPWAELAAAAQARARGTAPDGVPARSPGEISRSREG